MNQYYIANKYDSNKEFSSLVTEIESNNCSSIANIIRKLRQLENSSNSESSQVLSMFTRYLDSEISIRDCEIEKFCSMYYMSFVDSIKELMKIQQEASDLKQSSTEAKKMFGDSVNKLTQDCTELSKYFTILTNIDNAIENLESCLPVFDQYLKAEKCIKDKRYYPALKALNHLELNQMQRVNKYSFSETLRKEIPGMREKIKAASKDEIKDFLETVRKYSGQLGWCAMKQTADKSGMIISVDSPMKRKMEDSFLKNSRVSISIKSNGTLVNDDIQKPGALDKEIKELITMENLNDEDITLTDSDIPNIEGLVDFGPVYRCLHIHSVLGDRHEFEKCYRNQRKRQCTLLLTIKDQASYRKYAEFFSGIVGFFVIEDYIRYSDMSMVTRNYLDEQWSHSISRLSNFIQENSEHIDSIDILLDLKNHCVLFGKTMRSLGFNVVGFKDFYEILRNRYQTLLAIDYKHKFQAIFDGEDYTAISVESPSEMELVIELYPSFLSPEIDMLPYPKNLSFSWMVPRIYQLVKEHIKKSKQFADNLELSQTELEDQLNFTTNKLFADTLNPLLLTNIKNSSKKINQLVQLAVNMDELEGACNSLQSFIMSLVGVVYNSSHTAGYEETIAAQAAAESAMLNNSQQQKNFSKVFSDSSRSCLHAFKMFKELRGKIEDNIYSAMFAKIDDIFDEEKYQEFNSGSIGGSLNNSPSKKGILTASNPNDTVTICAPTEFIIDIITYLQATFESFTNLPPQLAQTVCFLCCNYLNEKIYGVLKVQLKISDRFLQQLSADIRALEDFTHQIPVAGVSTEQLMMKFEDLRQLVDLVLLADWATYIANFKTERNPYNRVAPHVAIQVLEKCRPNDSTFGSLLKSIKKNKQEKKDDEIIRQLRELR